MLKIGVFRAGRRVGKLIVDLAKNSNEIKLESVYARRELDLFIEQGTHNKRE